MTLYINPNIEEISREIGISRSTLIKRSKEVESAAAAYLSRIDKKIEDFIYLFKTSMAQITILTSQNTISIKKYIKYTKHLCSYWKSDMVDEVEKLFARYFFLTGFIAKSGRNSADGMDLYLTPFTKKRCVIMIVGRENNGLQTLF